MKKISLYSLLFFSLALSARVGAMTEQPNQLHVQLSPQQVQNVVALMNNPQVMSQLSGVMNQNMTIQSMMLQMQMQKKMLEMLSKDDKKEDKKDAMPASFNDWVKEILKELKAGAKDGGTYLVTKVPKQLAYWSAYGIAGYLVAVVILNRIPLVGPLLADGVREIKDILVGMVFGSRRKGWMEWGSDIILSPFRF